jgi:biopolymer transport protein ExbD
MRVSSPIPHHKARIEIIPLIDIMFFLLASFMMVSLSQVHVKGIKLNLPTGIMGQTQSRREYVALSVDKDGEIYYRQTKGGPERGLSEVGDVHRIAPGMPRFSSVAIAIPTTAISCD